jgi:Tol biopolymer transport system component
MKFKIVLIFILFSSLMVSCAIFKGGGGRTKVVYSAVYVPEEGGINFVKITNDADLVARPGYRASFKAHVTTNPVAGRKVSWYPYPVLALSKDGESIGYIACRNDATNVMIKSTKQGGGSIQQTFRSDIRNFSFSPDGSKICYSEYRGDRTGIYTMNFNQGTVTQRISPSDCTDNGPSISKDGNTIYFDRFEDSPNPGLWSYDIKAGLFANYSHGSAPCVDPTNNKIIYCSRVSYVDTYIRTAYTKEGQITFIDNGPRGEIWKLDTEKGTEEILLTERGHSFTTPQVSPDGKWILLTGANSSNNGVMNTNIFVIKSDGTRFTQLTYHPGNDMSAIWSPDGKYIYFISQRGTEKGIYNVWKMDFQLQ